jgi:hypothetical protein
MESMCMSKENGNNLKKKKQQNTHADKSLWVMRLCCPLINSAQRNH